MNDVEKMFNDCYRYQKILLEWILTNMKEDVVDIINKTPGYAIDRSKLYSKDTYSIFDYIRFLLESNEIKYRPFGFNYTIFSMCKECPNRLSYWVYPDLYDNRIKCIDIPGEHLILMLCVDISNDMVRELTVNADKKIKLHTIIKDHEKDRPWYKEYLSDTQYSYFKQFKSILYNKVKLDKLFDNEVFDKKKMESNMFLGRMFNKE